MGSVGIDNSSFQLTAERLNGKNYRECAQSIKLIIDGKGKLGYLIGEKQQPASTDAVSLQRWRSENSLVTAWLVNSMKPVIGKTYLFLPTTKDVWRQFEICTQIWRILPKFSRLRPSYGDEIETGKLQNIF